MVTHKAWEKNLLIKYLCPRDFRRGEMEEKMKKYLDTFLVIIGLLIIVGTVICYLFYNLNPTTMYAICGIVLVIMVLLLYIRNYKNNHYGGKFKNDFPDAH